MTAEERDVFIEARGFMEGYLCALALTGQDKDRRGAEAFLAEVEEILHDAC